MKRAISVTIHEDNLLWLKGQAGASDSGSVSEIVDRLIREARAGGLTNVRAVRSVVGSVDLPRDDEDLAEADAYVRSVFDRSLARPIVARERPPARKTKRRG